MQVMISRPACGFLWYDGTAVNHFPVLWNVCTPAATFQTVF